LPISIIAFCKKSEDQKKHTQHNHIKSPGIHSSSDIHTTYSCLSLQEKQQNSTRPAENIVFQHTEKRYKQQPYIPHIVQNTFKQQDKAEKFSDLHYKT